MANILVIDDDALVRDALEVFLLRDGHKVLLAADGESGLEAFRLRLPDLVLLDRDLPRMTGSVVLARIRELSAKVPVIILTGYDLPEDAERYIEAGANAFLSKKDGLLNALDEADRILGVRPAPAPTAPRPVPPAPAAPARRSKGLLLVADDDTAMTGAMARFLSSYGYEVLQASDGDEAERLARERRPAIVLLDISMPRRDGVQVLRDLVPELPDTGFVMLSGSDDENLARACLKIGAFDYLSKPANMGALETLIRARLTQAGRP